MLEQEQAILDKALSFSPKARAVLIEKLLDSLNQSDSSIDEQWAKEAEDRIKAYDAGELQGIPVEDVLAEYKRP